VGNDILLLELLRCGNTVIGGMQGLGQDPHPFQRFRYKVLDEASLIEL
jgi:hypothetical protein